MIGVVKGDTRSLDYSSHMDNVGSVGFRDTTSIMAN